MPLHRLCRHIRAIQSVIADRRSRGIARLPGAGRKELGPAGAES